MSDKKKAFNRKSCTPELQGNVLYVMYPVTEKNEHSFAGCVKIIRLFLFGHCHVILLEQCRDPHLGSQPTDYEVLI